MRANAYVSNRILGCARCPRSCPASTNRDCMTRSCKPCFLSVSRLTLASAGGITVAAAFFLPCIPLLGHSTQRTAAFHDHSGHPIAFPWIERLSRETGSATAQTHLTHACFNLDSVSSSSSEESSGRRSTIPGCSRSGDVATSKPSKLLGHKIWFFNLSLAFTGIFVLSNWWFRDRWVIVTHSRAN